MRQDSQTQPWAGPQAGGEGTGPARGQPTVGSQSCSLEMCHLHVGHPVPVSLSFLPLWVKILWEIPMCLSLVLGKQTQREGPERDLSRGAVSPDDSVVP